MNRRQAPGLALLAAMGLAHVVPSMLAGRTLLRNDYGAQQLPAFATLYHRAPIVGAPSWNPALFGGAPEEILPAMPRYPLAALASVFTPERAVPLFVGLHLGIAAICAFLFLRLTQGVSAAAAFLGAEVYGFGGTLWVHGMHAENLAVAAWLPAVAAAAFCLGAARERRAMSAGALAAVTALILLVGGGAPLVFLAVLASAVALAAGLWQAGGGNWRAFAAEALAAAPWVAAGLLVALAVASPGWLPFLDVTRAAARGQLSLMDTAQFSLSPPLLMRLVAPSLCYDDGACAWPYFVERWCYVGILALPLVGLGATSESGKRLLLLLMATVVLSFGTFGGLHILFYYLAPGYSFFRAPGRWMFLAGLLAAILAARGLDANSSRRAISRALAAMLLLAGVALIARARWQLVPSDEGSPAVRADFAWTAFFALAAAGWLAAQLWARHARRWLAPAACALLAFDLGVVAARTDVSEPMAEAAEPAVVAQLVQEAGVARISHDDDSGAFLLDGGGRWGYRNARGYSQLVPRAYSQLLDLGTEPSWRFSGLPARHDPALLRLLGVGAWLGLDGTAPVGFEPRPVAKGLGLAVWRAQARPFLAAVVGSAGRVLPGEAERRAALAIEPERTAVVVEETGLPATTPLGGSAAGSIALERPSSDQLLARVTAEREALAVIGEAWHPRWSATVDGAPARLFRADAVWMAVRVPPGAHQVRLTCRPAVPAWAWVASLLGLAGMAALLSRPLCQLGEGVARWRALPAGEAAG